MTIHLLSGVQFDNSDVVPRHPVGQLAKPLVGQLRPRSISNFPSLQSARSLARTWSGVPKYLSEIQAIAVHCGGGADPSSSSTSRPFRLSFPFSVFSGASFWKIHFHCGKDLNSHLEVNFVSVMGDLFEDSGDVLFLDTILEKYHVRHSLKELPEHSD